VITNAFPTAVNRDLLDQKVNLGQWDHRAKKVTLAVLDQKATEANKDQWDHKVSLALLVQEDQEEIRGL